MRRRVLVIGSTVADVVVYLDKLPRTAEDVLIRRQITQLGGCAFNVSDILRHAGTPHLLFSPVGSGLYGDFVRRELDARSIPRAIPDQEARNGCCYCFVESGGERTFVCEHGAEYRFKPEFFDAIDPFAFSDAYVCGLEIEEETGGSIIEFLSANRHIRPYFAPGPRIAQLPPERMRALLALRPVLHLNEREALEYTGLPVERAAARLHGMTREDVVITLGARGAYALSDGRGALVAGVPARAVDTIGAGDAHMGALIAMRVRGLDLMDSVRAANRVGALAVSTAGALIRKSDYEGLCL